MNTIFVGFLYTIGVVVALILMLVIWERIHCYFYIKKRPWLKEPLKRR